MYTPPEILIKKRLLYVFRSEEGTEMFGRRPSISGPDVAGGTVRGRLQQQQVSDVYP